MRCKVCTHHRSIGLSNQEKLDGRDMHNVWEKGEEGKPERKRPPVRPMYRWEGNVKMDLQEVRWGEMDWIDKSQDCDR
jgi:hypothetical protein